MNLQKEHNYTFYNYPRKCTREDYVYAINRIVDLHKDMKEIVGLYRFGSISAHGISDIDYFIVTEEDTNFRYKCPHNKLSEKEKYLFQHYPCAVMPKSLLPKLHLLAPIFELECVYNRGIMEGTLHIKISKEEAEMFLLDSIIMVYPRVLIEVLKNKKMDVRNALKVLYSLTHTLHLCEIIGITEKRWHQYAHSVELLRTGWFEEGKEEQNLKEVAALLDEALFILFQVVGELNLYYKQRKTISKTENNANTSYFIRRNHCVIFKENYKSKDALKQMQEFYKEKNMFVSILPATFAENLKEYSLTNTSFGNYINKYYSFIQNDKEKESITRLKKERCITLSALLEYSLKINYRHGAFTPFNLGYLDHQGITNKLRDTMWGLFYVAKIKRQIIK